MTSVAYGIAMPASRGVLGRPFPLLIDRLSAAPTAAFATFRLTWAYAGACIRVRRSSDNVEQDIGFVGSALDTAALLSFCGAGDGFVAKWYDQSGNARHLAQANAGLQPRIVSAGALITTINGLPSVQFNGANNYLAGIALSNYVAASNYTTIALSRPSAGSASDSGYLPGPFNDTLGYYWHGFGATKFVAGHLNGGNRQISTPASYPNTFVSTHLFDGTARKGWINGGAATSIADTLGIQNSSSNIQMARASTAYMNGALASALTFNSAISLSDLNMIGAGFATKGGVTWTTAT